MTQRQEPYAATVGKIVQLDAPQAPYTISSLQRAALKWHDRKIKREKLEAAVIKLALEWEAMNDGGPRGGALYEAEERLLEATSRLAGAMAGAELQKEDEENGHRIDY